MSTIGVKEFNIQYTHKFGAGASVGATPFNYKLCPWGQRGLLEGSSRLYETKYHHLVTKKSLFGTAMSKHIAFTH
jgi:hypothetical protein